MEEGKVVYIEKTNSISFIIRQGKDFFGEFFSMNDNQIITNKKDLRFLKTKEEIIQLKVTRQAVMTKETRKLIESHWK